MRRKHSQSPARAVITRENPNSKFAISSASACYQAQELSPRHCRLAEVAAHRARHHAAAGLLHATHGHAQVLRLDYDGYSIGREDLHDRLGDLARQLLLQLWPPRVTF